MTNQSITDSSKNNRCQARRTRGHFNRSAALILLLAITRTVGSDAGALPFTRSAPSIAKSNHEALASAGTCVANLKKSNGQCIIPRGGSATAAASASESVLTSESLKMVGIVSVFVTVRESVAASYKEWWRTADTAKFLLAGAVAGIVSRTAVSPLEVIATAQMVRGGNKNIVGELAELFKSEGVKGFFKGNGANCLKVAPTRGVQFFAFEQFKQKLVDYKRTSMGLDADADVRLNPLERLIAGGFAGMIASSMVYPIEVVKTMLTMYPGKYPGIGAAFRGVISEVGPKGLYAGLGPTLIAMFPYVGVEFMIYETSKIAIEQFMKQENDGVAVAMPIIISLGLGALAGAAAQTSAHPLDVIRKRLQIQGINGNPVLYKGTIDAFSGVCGKEGLGALYKGLGPACVATIPGTGIAYITYEFMKQFFQLNSV
jgi:solute carrier family 25 phosphate transporter 23/24/25/41